MPSTRFGFVTMTDGRSGGCYDIAAAAVLNACKAETGHIKKYTQCALVRFPDRATGQSAQLLLLLNITRVWYAYARATIHILGGEARARVCRVAISVVRRSGLALYRLFYY